MDKSEFRVLINQCFLRGNNTVQTKQWLYKYCEEFLTSRQMVEKWIGEFERGRTSTNDAERIGGPKYVTTPEIIKKIHDLVWDHSKLKVRELA